MNRVVVTGMGIVSSVGVKVSDAWKHIIESKSGISSIDLFDASFSPSRVAGQVPLGNYDEGGYNPDEWMDAKEQRRVGKFIIYSLVATDEALKDAGLYGNMSDEDKENCGVYIGSGIGGLQEIYESASNLHDGNYRKMTPFFIPSALINLAAGYVSIKHGLKGPNLAPTAACAASAHAIGDSYLKIKHGICDIMVVGGTESSINPLGVAGFARMGALSTHFNDNPASSSRPWDKQRDGFVISEGAGILILEDLDKAKARGAHIYAEILGYGASSDAHHVTSPSDSGEGAYLCMRRALDAAKIAYEDIGYINAHGTSTPLGDIAELRAVSNLFGNHSASLAMSSTKSATGHALGAAGAMEAIFTIKALNDSILPPTLNLETPEDNMGIDLLPFKAKEKNIRFALTNSFGFGGTNGSVVFKKFS